MPQDVIRYLKPAPARTNGRLGSRRMQAILFIGLNKLSLSLGGVRIDSRGAYRLDAGRPQPYSVSAICAGCTVAVPDLNQPPITASKHDS